MRAETGRHSLQRSHTRFGFTLLELLIYLALLSVALTVVITLVTSLIQSEARGSVRHAVDASASGVLTQMTEAARAATGINTANSLFAIPLGRLSLAMRDASRSPAVFSVNNGRLEVTEGSGSPVALTSDAVQVVGFQLTRLNPAGAKEGVRIELTVNFRDPGNDPRFQFSHTYVTGLVLR